MDLSNYATKKELKHAKGVDKSNLAGKSNFIALKAEVDKLDINKLVNIPTSLNNLKTKANNLDARKLKTVPIYLKKLGDVVGKKVLEKAVCNKLNVKISNLENKIPDPSTLVHSD